MIAKDISVSVNDFDGKLYINITMSLPGSLEREPACPESKSPPANAGTRVKESSRKAKAKELRKFLEVLEFSNDS